MQQTNDEKPSPPSEAQQTPRKNIAPAWLEIDLDKVASNTRKLKAAAGPHAKILAMVKAQAYGCGAEMISRAALENGAELLGVANVAEALSLRNAGLDCPILIFGRPDEAELESIVEKELLATVFDLTVARQLHIIAGKHGRKVKVHLKLDTGMGRLGLLPKDSDEFLEGFAACSNLIMEGVYTHFAVADCDRRFTQEQIELFHNVVQKIRSRGYQIPFIHAANSAALLNRCCETFDMVRPGITIYGLYGSPLVSREINLDEVLSFKAKVAQVKRIPAGASVSYGREFIALMDTTIATISAGYADGVPFRLAKKGNVLIHGRRFPIVGRVTMDMTMVDVGDCNSISIGDEVVIFGQSGRAAISIVEVAEKVGTIEHEVICGIGPRVPRVYLRNGSIAGIQKYTLGQA
jgi:alanine racemase